MGATSKEATPLRKRRNEKSPVPRQALEKLALLSLLDGDGMSPPVSARPKTT